MRIERARSMRAAARPRMRRSIVRLLRAIAAGLALAAAPAVAAEAPATEPEQVALTQSAPSASAATIAPSNEGHAKYRLSAATYFDEYSGDGPWIEAHVDVIKAYPPFGDVYVQYHKPVIGYHDPATQGFAPLSQPEIEAFVNQVKRDMGVGYA